MYSSTLLSTSALKMGVVGQRHAPAALPPGKDPVPIVQEAGCTPGPVWTGAENLARNESLYLLSYPGCLYVYIYIYTLICVSTVLKKNA